MLVDADDVTLGQRVGPEAVDLDCVALRTQREHVVLTVEAERERERERERQRESERERERER